MLRASWRLALWSGMGSRWHQPDREIPPLSIFPISLISLHVLAISNCPRLQSQDVVLFNDTIMHNVRYGRLSATDEEVTPRSREQLPCPS